MIAKTFAHTALSGLLLFAVVAAPGAAGCKQGKITPAQTGTDLNQAVARIDDQVVTVGDLQEKINKQSPFTRARYTSVEKKKEFLDSIVRFEVLAAEARRRGYDQDPEVIRLMKQQMISKFMQKDFDAKLKVEDVPDADVEKYYKNNQDEFNQAEGVRVSQIFTAEKAKADKAYAEAKAAPKTDQKAFRDLVTKYSEDEVSKQMGGDLTFFERTSTSLPKPVVDAAFALTDIGDVSAAVKTDKGWHVLKLTQRRPAVSRPLTEVKRTIQQRLFRDMRTKAMDDFVADLRKKTKVEIFEDKLGKVLVDTGLAQPPTAAGGAAPGQPLMGAGAGGPPPPLPPAMAKTKAVPEAATR